MVEVRVGDHGGAEREVTPIGIGPIHQPVAGLPRPVGDELIMSADRDTASPPELLALLSRLRTVDCVVCTTHRGRRPGPPSITLRLLHRLTT